MNEEGELVQKWKDGDDAAGNELVRQLFPRIFGFFREKVSEDAVQDLTQQTFVELSRCLPKIDPERGVAPLLFTIARRQLLHHYRYNRRHPVDPLQASVEMMMPTPSKILHSQEVKDVFAAALRRLPLDYQLCLELRYWQKLPVDAIAEILEVGTGAAKMRLHRARGELKKQLEELGLPAAIAATTLAEFGPETE